MAAWASRSSADNIRSRVLGQAARTVDRKKMKGNGAIACANEARS
jgi:hypothetical protein